MCVSEKYVLLQIKFESSALTFVCFEISTLLKLEISSPRRVEISSLRSVEISKQTNVKADDSNFYIRAVLL